jgi:DNA-binding GntR family transcriptional regulator
MMVPREGEAETTLEKHRTIITALKSGDPETAARAMRDHLETAYHRTVAVLDGPGLN